MPPSRELDMKETASISHPKDFQAADSPIEYEMKCFACGAPTMSEAVKNGLYLGKPIHLYAHRDSAARGTLYLPPLPFCAVHIST